MYFFVRILSNQWILLVKKVQLLYLVHLNQDIWTDKDLL